MLFKVHFVKVTEDGDQQKLDLIVEADTPNAANKKVRKELEGTTIQITKTKVFKGVL